MKRTTKKCQSGGALGINFDSLVMPISNTGVAPIPLQTLNQDSILTNKRYEDSVQELLNATKHDYGAIKEMARIVYGNPNKEASMKIKSKVKRFRERQTGGDLISQLGYRDDSPFKSAPSLNINSSSISMENVSTPLYGTSNQTGETKLMKPNKKYNFKNTTSVTEIPAYQTGGDFNPMNPNSYGNAQDGITPLVSKDFMAKAKNYKHKVSKYKKT